MGTVRLDITVSIDQRDDNYDTGLSVAAWNDLTDAGRSAIYQSAWNAMAEQDNGGVTVLTPGAVQL